MNPTSKSAAPALKPPPLWVSAPSSKPTPSLVEVKTVATEVKRIADTNLKTEVKDTQKKPPKKKKNIAQVVVLEPLFAQVLQQQGISCTYDVKACDWVLSLKNKKSSNQKANVLQSFSDLIVKEFDKFSKTKDFLKLIDKVNSLKTELIFETYQTKAAIEKELSLKGKPVRFISHNETFYWLSNFFQTVVVINNHAFSSIEHAYQAKKYPVGSKNYNAIRFATTSSVAKQLGGQSTIQPAQKISLMKECLPAKFNQNSYLKQWLIKTAGHALQEDTKDRFWGYTGSNHLGKILEAYRATLL